VIQEISQVFKNIAMIK